MANLAELLSRLHEGWTLPGDNMTLSLLSGRFTTLPFRLTHTKRDGLWEIKLFYRSREIGCGLSREYALGLVTASQVAEANGFCLNLESERIDILKEVV